MQTVEIDEVAITPTAVPVRKPPRKVGFSPFYMAIGSVMLRAKKAKLEHDDLLLTHPSDDVPTNANKMKATWEASLAKYYEAKAEAKANGKPAPKLPSLWRAVWPVFRPLWLMGFSSFLCSKALTFVGPFMLGYAVRLIENTQNCGFAEQKLAVEQTTLNPGGDALATTPPSISAACLESNQIHMGYVFAALLFASKCLEACTNSWHSHLMQRSALRARAGLSMLIYRKCLWLTGMGNSDATTGRIQNLMANDANFFLQFAPMFNSLLVAPLELAVAFVWLAYLIGPSFLAGLGTMILCVPLQGMIIGKYFGKQKARLKLTDERVKLTNEMVQGMRVIKMYAWETTIFDKIAKIRKTELKLVRSQRFYSACLGVFMVCQAMLVTVVTFTVYAASGNPMKASIILPAVSLLQLLRLPLAFLPMCAMQYAQLLVAIGRIKTFLMNDELPAEIKARCIAASRQYEDSVHSGTDAAASTSTPSVKIDIDGQGSAVGTEAGGAVRSTPSFATTCTGSAEASNLDAEVSIHGSFRWKQPDVPAGKGKGKGKGKGGAKSGKAHVVRQSFGVWDHCPPCHHHPRTTATIVAITVAAADAPPHPLSMTN